MAETSPVEGALHCANHPGRETRLRCNKCDKPICTDCAVLTPVGYRCRECVREQQDKFYTAGSSDRLKGYMAAIAGGIALGLTAILLGAFLGTFLGVIVAFFAGPAVGGAVGELAWRAAGRKRSRQFNVYVTLIAAVLAALLTFIVLGLNIAAWVMVALAASATFARLRTAS